MLSNGSHLVLQKRLVVSVISILSHVTVEAPLLLFASSSHFILIVGCTDLCFFFIMHEASWAVK